MINSKLLDGFTLTLRCNRLSTMYCYLGSIELVSCPIRMIYRRYLLGMRCRPCFRFDSGVDIVVVHLNHKSLQPWETKPPGPVRTNTAKYRNLMKIDRKSEKITVYYGFTRKPLQYLLSTRSHSQPWIQNY